MRESYKLFSLYSGAGGLDLGFKLTGEFKIEFGNDISGAAAKTYSQDFNAKVTKRQPTLEELPAVFQGSVAKLDFDRYRDLQPDLIIGGPPCQDFSIVRGPEEERIGTSLTRGKLYSHFIRALIHLQPKVFVFENVPGLKSANKGKAYDAIIEDFSDVQLRWKKIRQLVGNNSNSNPKGYDIMFDGLVDAYKIGVPQARKRVIIIGHRKDLSFHTGIKPDELKQAISDLLEGKDQLMGRYPLTPLEVFEGKPLPELGEKYKEVMEDYSDIHEQLMTPVALDWKQKVWKKLTLSVVEDYLALNGIQYRPNEETEEAFREHAELLRELRYSGVRVSDLRCSDKSNELPNEKEKTLERMRRIPPGENYKFVRGTKWKVEGKGISLIYARIHPLRPAYTVVAHGGGGTRSYHYERNRSALTNREKARLQTFPDDFMFEGNGSEVRAQIGEAVPPLMGKRIAEATIRLLREL